MKTASCVLAWMAITALVAGCAADKVHRKMLQTVDPQGNPTPDSTTGPLATPETVNPEAVPLMTDPQTQSSVTPSDSGPDSWQFWGGGRWGGRIWQRPGTGWGGGNWNDDRWNVWDGWNMQTQAAGQVPADAQVASVQGVVNGPVVDAAAMQQVAAETEAVPVGAVVEGAISP